MSLDPLLRPPGEYVVSRKEYRETYGPSNETYVHPPQSLRNTENLSSNVLIFGEINEKWLANMVGKLAVLICSHATTHLHIHI